MNAVFDDDLVDLEMERERSLDLASWCWFSVLAFRARQLYGERQSILRYDDSSA